MRILESKKSIKGTKVIYEISTKEGNLKIEFYPNERLETLCEINPVERKGYYHPEFVSLEDSYPFLHEIYHLDERFVIEIQTLNDLQSLLDLRIHKIRRRKEEDRIVFSSTGRSGSIINAQHLQNLIEDLFIDYFLVKSGISTSEEIRKIRESGMVDPPKIGRGIFSVAIADVFGFFSRVYERKVLEKPLILYFSGVSSEILEEVEKRLVRVIDERIKGADNLDELDKLVSALFNLSLGYFSLFSFIDGAPLNRDFFTLHLG